MYVLTIFRYQKQQNYMKMTSSLSIVNYECFNNLHKFWRKQEKSKKLKMIASLEKDVIALTQCSCKGSKQKKSKH